MTKVEAEQTLRFCQMNKIPKPQRYPISGKNGMYQVSFNSQRMRGQFVSYKGALNFCLSILDEKGESGWGV